MARVAWKEDAVISIAVGEGVFVLAQMLKSPYLLIYDDFRKDDCWDEVNLSEIPVLLCHAVTRQFLKFSEIKKQNLKAVKHENLPKHWISITPGRRKNSSLARNERRKRNNNYRRRRQANRRGHLSERITAGKNHNFFNFFHR